MAVKSNVLQMVVRLKALDQLSNPLKKTNSAVGTTVDRLRKLERIQKQINGFKKLQSDVNDTSRAMEQARGKVSELQRQLIAAENPSKNLREEYKAAQRALKSLASDQDKQNRKLAEMRKEMQQAGIATENLHNYERKLAGTIGKANSHLDQQKTKLRQLAEQEARLQGIRERHGKAMQHTAMVGGAGYAAMHTGQRVAGGLSFALRPGMELDAAMSEVQALTGMNKDDKRMAELRQQAINLGATTKFSGADAARGQAFLAMAGFTPESIKAAMPGVLHMAAAGDMDLGRTADIASNIMGGFNLEASQAGKVADILTKGFTTSNTTLEMLGQTMGYVGPVARQAGMSLEESVAMAGLLGNVGIQAEKAGTTLRAMVLRLAAPVGPARKALASLGLEVLDASGNMKNLPQVLSEVAKATEKMGNGKRLEYLKQIFGEEPAAGMAELLNQAGVGGITKYLDIIHQHQGAAENISKIKMDNLVGDLEELTSSLENVGIAINDNLKEPLRAATQWLTKMADGVARLITEYPTATKVILGAVAAFAAVAVVGGGLLITYAAIAGPLKILLFGLSLLTGKSITTATALKAMGGGIAAASKALFILGKGLLTNPIFLIAAALAGVAYLIYKHWDEIIAYLKRVRDYWVAIGTDMIEGLVNGLSNGMSKLKGKVFGTADAVKNWFKEKLGIHSPSRVFMGFGTDTLRGYQKGLDAETRSTINTMGNIGKRITAAGSGLVLGAGVAVADTEPLRLGSAAYRGDTIHITINAAPSHSAQDIAAEVERILNQRERRHAIRQGSKLRD